MITNSQERDRLLEMACLSQLAYVACKQETAIVERIVISGYPPFVQQYQTIQFLHSPRLFDAEKLVCCGLIASTPREIVIAIRGTENLEDYFYNLLATPNSQAIHRGCYAYVESFWQQLQDFLAKEEPTQKHILVAGHSLGGAAALLITKRLQELSFRSLETYTFGSPPVSSQEFKLDTPVYRLCNAGDFIPHLPQIAELLIKRMPRIQNAIALWQPNLLPALTQYRHQGIEYLIDRDYQIHQRDRPQMGNIRQWLKFSQLLLPQLRSDGKNGLRHIIKALIKASLQEHRAIEYVSRLNGGQLPPWCSLSDESNLEEENRNVVRD
jgi:pimeloyl-ACP methyl ester carboxylesterase